MVWIVLCLVLVTDDVKEPGCNELFLRVDLCCFDENNHFLTEIEAGSTKKFLVIRFSVYENHAGQIFIPHRCRRHCVGGDAPVNFGRRRRRQKSAASAKHVFSEIPEKKSFYSQNFLMTLF